METDDIKRFYEFLGHKEETELRLLIKGVPKPIQMWVKNQEEFLKAIEKYDGKYNIYVGLNERTANGDLDEDVKFITNIGHDIDAHSGKYEDFLLAQEVAFEIKKGIMSKGYEEPMMVCSGQGFWIIHHIPPIENNEENARKIKEFGKIIKEKYEKEGIEIDSTVYNASRIARVPGTININHPEKVLSFIVGGYSEKEDERLKAQILNIPIKAPIVNPSGNAKKENCAFLDYCLTHEVPKGERHKIISRNMSIYLFNHPAREILKGQYSQIQNGANTELDNWIKGIEKEGIDAFPFSCGELINFQKKYKISLKCRGCPRYLQYKREKEEEERAKEMNAIENNEEYTDLQKEVLLSITLKDYNGATEALAREIKKRNYIYTTKDDIKSEMWIYRDGIYIPNGKSYVREFCRKILEKAYNNWISNIVISKIETDTFIEQEIFFENKYINELPVQNGILNVLTRTLEPYDPKKVFFNKLPVLYNPEALNPHIEKFLKDILANEEDLIVIYEVIGSGLYKDYFTEKAVMLLGTGRNGKSKLLELMKRLVGVENCCSVPIRSMNENNSSLCELYMRLFNLAGDLTGGDLKDTGVFKQTVGRDILQTHRKFLRDLKFVNHAKHIFACNELPRVFDTTDGFWDKWVLLNFPYKFITKEEFEKLTPEEKQWHKIKDPIIIDKITTPEELSGLLNKALDGLHRLLKQNNYSQTKGSKEIKDFWIRNSDSFTAFCIDNIKQDNTSFITKRDLRLQFNIYCKKFNLKGAGDKAIKATLEDRYGVVESRKLQNDEQQFVWEGINFKWRL